MKRLDYEKKLTKKLLKQNKIYSSYNQVSRSIINNKFVNKL